MCINVADDPALPECVDCFKMISQVTNVGPMRAAIRRHDFVQRQQYHHAMMGTFDVGRFESSLTFALLSCTLDVASICHEVPSIKAKSKADELIDHPEAIRDAS